jgi:hypothetical protein
MDELERDLRAEFEHLADGPEPSDDLVGKTLDRSVHLRRHRRVLTASSIAAITLAAFVVVASVAGAGTHPFNVAVTGPPDVELPETTTTTTAPMAPVTTTTVTSSLPVSRNTVPPAPSTTTTPGISFVPATCPSSDAGTSPELAEFTLLADGTVRVHYTWMWSPHVGAFIHYRFDNGATGSSDYEKVYTPDEFGQHWYDEWTAFDNGTVGCSVRHTFDVDPSTATPDTTPVSTTLPVTTTVPDSTTVPESTTVPDTTIPTG